jgi:3,4-dihydroxy-2-butanone 4-phosphate synthase
MRTHQLDATLDRLRLGCPAILLDDRKEAEGDLFCPAAVVRPEVLQFMVRRASGLLCLALPRGRLEEIGIPRLSEGIEILANILFLQGQTHAHLSNRPDLANPQLVLWTRFVWSLTSQGHTADTPFHFPVDLASQHSGISVAERWETIQALLRPDATIDCFTVPGHLATLGAHPQGLAGRWGHTEASVDLCRALGLAPAGLLCEIVGDDGHMLRGEDLEAFARETRIDLLPLSAIPDLFPAGPVNSRP